MLDKELLVNEINQLGELYAEQESAEKEFATISGELEAIYAEYEAKESDALARQTKAEIKAEVTKQLVAKQIDYLVAVAKREVGKEDPTPNL